MELNEYEKRRSGRIGVRQVWSNSPGSAGSIVGNRRAGDHRVPLWHIGKTWLLTLLRNNPLETAVLTLLINTVENQRIL